MRRQKVLTASTKVEFLRQFQGDGNQCQIVREIVRFEKMSHGVQDYSNMLNLPKIFQKG